MIKSKISNQNNPPALEVGNHLRTLSFTARQMSKQESKLEEIKEENFLQRISKDCESFASRQ